MRLSLLFDVQSKARLERQRLGAAAPLGKGPELLGLRAGSGTAAAPSTRDKGPVLRSLRGRSLAGTASSRQLS